MFLDTRKTTDVHDFLVRMIEIHGIIIAGKKLAICQIQLNEFSFSAHQMVTRISRFYLY